VPGVIEDKHAEAVKAWTAPALPLLGIQRALLRIGNKAWMYQSSTNAFVPVESSTEFRGTVLSFPGGTLSLNAPLASPAAAMLQTFLESVGEATRNRDLLDTLCKTSLALSANLNLRTLLTDLMGLTKEALGAEASSVMLLDGSKATLYWELSERDQSGVLHRRSLPVGEGVAGTVAKTGEAVVVADAQHDQRVARWVDEATGFRTRSILCVPIRFKSETIGVVQLLNKMHGTFTEQDKELLELIAAEAGVAIENARLYGTLEERVRQRTEELTQAIEQLSRTLEELKAAQTQLIQSEKMAALGKLVAGVAHEINTPLGAVTSNIDVLDRGFRKLAPLIQGEGKALITTLEPLLKTNAEACQRISAIVKNLKTFARLDEAEWKSADLREGMESTLTLLHHLHKGRIEIVREYADIPRIECHPGQINQVFMNVLVNAIQAIQAVDGRGTIWIRLGREGDHVKVEVQDTGIGIAEADLPKVFDPGFTTKGVGVGTGLGLSICYRIITDHHGTIQAASRKGQGSTFTVHLPIRKG
jgi:signal transduction histidine kinase